MGMVFSRSAITCSGVTPCFEAAAPASSMLRSVRIALDVLECFATDEELGVTDVATKIGVAKSTAHRVLTTLAGRGFIEQDPDSGLYRLGLHLYELGQLTISRNPLRHAALPTLRQIASQTSLTANLAIADGPDLDRSLMKPV